MREARSIVNACFAFAVFLLVYALVHPGSTKGSGTSPRFLRMEVEELKSGRKPERHSLSVPYFLVGKAFRFAALGAFHRELELQFDADLDADSFRAVWAELKSSPDGTEVTRNHDGDTLRWKKNGEFVVLQVVKHSSHSFVSESDSESPSEDADSESSRPPKPAAPPVPVTDAGSPPAPSPPATVAISTEDTERDELILKMPVRLVEAAIAAERDFDAETLISELGTVNRGDLIDIRHQGRRGHEAHVRVWVE